MLVSYPMYPISPVTLKAYSEGLRQWFIHYAVINAETVLDLIQPDDLPTHWLDPNLLLSQACGYPLVTSLKDKVKLVGTFAYDAEGCVGSNYSSMLVARADDPAQTLADFRGRTAAYNSTDSQSGYNIFKAVIAPLTQDKPFFGQAIATGSHIASVQAVVAGQADIATIDCVSLAFFKQQQPELIAQLKIIGRTPHSIGLPLITSIQTTDEQVKLMQQALAAMVADETQQPTLREMKIIGFEATTLANYEICRQLQMQSMMQGVFAL